VTLRPEPSLGTVQVRAPALVEAGRGAAAAAAAVAEATAALASLPAGVAMWGDAAAALDRFRAGWRCELARMHSEAERLSTSVESAAAAYLATDVRAAGGAAVP
jgi:hypothetical protein